MREKFIRHLPDFAVLAQSFTSIVASVAAVAESGVASKRSTLGSFTVSRGLRLRCSLHRQESAGAVADSNSASVAFGVGVRSSSGS